MGGQSFLQFRNMADGPLVVASNIISGSDDRQALRRPGGVICGDLVESVQQVAHKEDVIRFLLPDSVEKLCTPLAEAGGMQVSQHHDPAAVEALWQIPKDRVKPGDLQSRIIPADKQNRQDQDEQRRENRPQRTAPARVFCHRKAASLPQDQKHVKDVKKRYEMCRYRHATYYIISSICKAREKIYKETQKTGDYSAVFRNFTI